MEATKERPVRTQPVASRMFLVVTHAIYDSLMKS
jgi:hypothetical protein